MWNKLLPDITFIMTATKSHSLASLAFLTRLPAFFSFCDFVTRPPSKSPLPRLLQSEAELQSELPLKDANRKRRPDSATLHADIDPKGKCPRPPGFNVRDKKPKTSVVMVTGRASREPSRRRRAQNTSRPGCFIFFCCFP